MLRKYTLFGGPLDGQSITLPEQLLPPSGLKFAFEIHRRSITAHCGLAFYVLRKADQHGLEAAYYDLDHVNLSGMFRQYCIT